MQITKEYDFQQGGKLTLTMTYTLEKPKCENTIVTSNFKCVRVCVPAYALCVRAHLCAYAYVYYTHSRTRVRVCASY